jgi:hypothetical protein
LFLGKGKRKKAGRLKEKEERCSVGREEISNRHEEAIGRQQLFTVFYLFFLSLRDDLFCLPCYDHLTVAILLPPWK